MNDRIKRPIFYEGQVLGAADLTTTVEHSRGQQARHEHYLHLWGIAHGLTLTGKDKQTAQGANYQEVTLSAGMAIDGTGREIVVPEAERLSEDLFDQLNVAITDEEAQYPVFLIGRDEPAPPTTLVGACDSTLPTAVFEGYEVTFGRPGDELDLDKQDAPDVIDGPGSGTWHLLLGFVQWDASIKHFKDVANESGGIGRRYAGVLADTIAARGGRLTLRTVANNQPGKPAIVMDETDGGLLTFGMLTAQGVVTRVFSVNAKGDVEAEGTIKGAVLPGSVQIQSGVATDGIVLPLPPGITEEQVTEGKVTLHIQVTPLLPRAFSANSIDVPFECEIEKATRRVLCRFRRGDFTTPASPTFNDLPGACNYIVLASVPATGG